MQPAQSIFNDCIEKHFSNKISLRKCIFVWSVKDRVIVDSLNVGYDLEKLDNKFECLPESFQPDLVHVTQLDSCMAGSVISSNELELQPVSGSAGKVARSTIPDNSVFHCEYYLTCVRRESEHAAANIVPSEQPYVKHGRPDLPKLFSEVVELCAKESIGHVAVVTCGPLPMTQEVHMLCDAKNKANVKFDLHVEEFGF